MALRAEGGEAAEGAEGQNKLGVIIFNDALARSERIRLTLLLRDVSIV